MAVWLVQMMIAGLLLHCVSFRVQHERVSMANQPAQALSGPLSAVLSWFSVGAESHDIVALQHCYSTAQKDADQSPDSLIADAPCLTH